MLNIMGSRDRLFSSFCARYIQDVLMYFVLENGSLNFFVTQNVKTVLRKPSLCGWRRKTLRGNQSTVNCFTRELFI